MKGRLASREELLVQLAIAAIAGVLLFWGLGERYLWQDEAATAVLAQRMLRFGRPLAYDGVNLVTIDMLSTDDQAAIAKRTHDPQSAIEYYVRRGAFKPDTTWKWQPWGLFLLPAASFKLLGPTTTAARLPFALAAWAAVLLLFRLARRSFASVSIAALSAMLLLCNPYWVLHARQCRYYSLSSLFLVLILIAWLRWQSGRRGGATGFVVAAWCWFQVDYGTVWPVLAVLLIGAWFAIGLRRTLPAAAILAAALAPFVYYYELWGRGSSQEGTWLERLRDNLFNMNEYLTPALLVAAALALLVVRRQWLGSAERKLIAVSIAILAALALWTPSVAVYPFLRYTIVAAPAGALITAWLLVRLAGPRFAWLCAALLVVTPWASLPMRPLAPPPDWATTNTWLRPEWRYLFANLFEYRPDPNRLVIDWLRRNAAPSDEILINYEDFPLMFYLPNPIRGGVSAFRVEDDSRKPPSFAILRRSVDFVQWPAFQREISRSQWAPVPLHAPDVIWGNNPDPMAQDDPRLAPDLYIARRVGP